MMPWGEGQISTSPTIRAILGQAPAFAAHVSPLLSRSSPAHAEKNQTRQLKLHCGLTPKMQITEPIWISFWGVQNYLWRSGNIRTSPENAQRNIFSYCPFLWLTNSKKNLANERVFPLKLFLCSSQSFINPGI